MNIPASIAAETALTRQNVTLSVIKNNAEQDRQIANVIEQSIETAPTRSTRGTNLNILV